MQSIGADPGGASAPADPDGGAIAHLRLYVARSTPNSVRAESNLSAALEGMGSDLPKPSLEIIDVFTQARRAITDGIIVTPTLIGLSGGKRVVLMGDLADRAHLESALLDLLK